MSNHRYYELDRLSAILEAELNGHGIDHAEVHHLAKRIAEQFPQVASTMNMLAERMAAVRH